MNNKTLLKECKCLHCQQKLNQINNSRLYWNKLISNKNLTQFPMKLSNINNYFKIKKFQKAFNKVKNKSIEAYFKDSCKNF